MSTILDSVTEIEDRVLETVKNLQQPVVEYVRKGVDRVEDRIPKPTYPDGLPKPGDVVESQFNFAKALLETQREFVSELFGALAPLVREESEDGEPAPAPKSTAAPAVKAPAKPAAKSTKKTSK